MAPELYYCKRCDESKPLGEFPPSKARNKSQWCRSCLRQSARIRIGAVEREVRCQCCNKLFRSAFRKALYCSRGCKDAAKNAAISAALRASKPERHCPQCGVALPAEMRADARFCSEQCNSAAHQATRKARWRGGRDAEYVSRAYIIQRDGGRCHLCGGKPRPGDIHMDHVIPLSLGGDHSPENVRVACSFCNLSKHNRPRGEQLLLVG